jgi:hypothetical protein
LFAQKKETKKRAAKSKCSAAFGRPTHMNRLYTLRLSFYSN